MLIWITVNCPTTASLVLEQGGSYLVDNTTITQPLQWTTPFDPAHHLIALTPDPQFPAIQRCQILADAIGQATAGHVYTNGTLTDTFSLVGTSGADGITIGRPR